MTFSPAGTAQRSARLYIDAGAAAGADGPIVFYWYGTGGQPTQAVQGLTQAGIDRIKQAGGMVVAPTHVNGGTFPWIGGGNWGTTPSPYAGGLPSGFDSCAL